MPTWWFKVPFLGWLSDPFKWLSDLQLGDERITLNHLANNFWYWWNVDMVWISPEFILWIKRVLWDMFNNFDSQQAENIVVFKFVQFKTQMFSKKNLWMPTSQGPIAWPSASHVCEPGVGVEVEKDRRIDMWSFPFIPTSLIQGWEDKFQMFWQYIGIFA